MSGTIYETCPFNPSHRYKSTRKEIHLQKCQINHINEGYVRCIFNYNHIIKNDKKLEHLKECSAADENVCNLILRMSNAKARYKELYGHEDTTKEPTSLDNDPDIHSKVKHWLENTSDPITHEEIFEASVINSIVCNEGNTLPPGYDPHECEEIEEYYRNLRKASDKQFSSKSCPRPLRTANYFIKAELENCKKLSSEGTSDSVSNTSIDSAVPLGSINNPIQTKNALKRSPREPCQNQNEPSSQRHLNITNGDQVDIDSVSSKTTANYRSSLLHPKREELKSTNFSSFYENENLPIICPEDSISNVGVTNQDRESIDLDSLISESFPLDLVSVVSNELSQIKTKTRSNKKTVLHDANPLTSNVSRKGILNKNKKSTSRTSSDLDSLISESVPHDLKSMLRSKVTSKQKKVEESIISSDIDSLISESVPFDLKGMINSKVTSIQKEVEESTSSSDMDSLISESVPHNVKGMLNTKVTSIQKKIEESKSSSDLDSLISESVPHNLESMLNSKVTPVQKQIPERRLPSNNGSQITRSVPFDLKSIISNSSFLTANNDIPYNPLVFTKSEEKPMTRSISVQTEETCKCFKFGLGSRKFY